MNQAESIKDIPAPGAEEGVSEERPHEKRMEKEAELPANLSEEAEGLREIYPEFDLAAALEEPILGALLRGERKPTLRQLYEMTHGDSLVQKRMNAEVQARVSEAVSAAVSEAVTRAIRETEERLLSHIRARGQRPPEVGMGGAAGIRMHPAVHRLTRKERALLAKRAENGETIQF